MSTSFVTAQASNVITAYNYLTGQEYERAREAIDKAILDDRTGVSAKTWMIRGDIYRNIYTGLDGMGKNDAQGIEAISTAIESYLKALTFDTRRIDVKMMKQNLLACTQLAFSNAVASYNAKNLEVAVGLFQNVIDGKAKLGEVDSLAHFNQALAFERMRRYDEAIRAYNKCIEIGYEKEKVYGFVVYLLRAQDKIEEGAEVNRKGLDEYPNSPSLLSYYVNYLLSKENNTEALGYLDQLLTKDPNNKTLFYARGTLYEGQGEYLKARTDYLKAVEIDPDFFDALYNLGAHYFNRGAEMIDQANSMEVEDEYNRLVKVADGHFDQALVYLNRAHELDQNNKGVLESLFQIYARKNDSQNYDRVKAKLKELNR